MENYCIFLPWCVREIIKVTVCECQTEEMMTYKCQVEAVMSVLSLKQEHIECSQK